MIPFIRDMYMMLTKEPKYRQPNNKPVDGKYSDKQYFLKFKIIVPQGVT